jgi:predicted nucleic acid-binding protein
MRHFWTVEVRLVVDTNVRLAAELTASKETSPAARLLRLIQRKVYDRVLGKQLPVTVVWLRSRELQDELREQLTKRGFPLNWILSIVQETIAFSERVDVTEEDIDALRTQAPPEAHDDLHVIACAIKGKATHIVTYDDRNLLTPTNASCVGSESRSSSPKKCCLS